MKLLRSILFLSMNIATFVMESQEASIPLQVFFENPEKINVKISPDGTMISYLKSDEHRRLQVWIVLDDQTEVQVTDNKHRSILNYLWSYDSKSILYLQDENGNENWNLFKTDITTKETVNLTPFDKVQVRVLKYDKHYPNSIILGINKDKKERHDPYKLDLKTHGIVSMGQSLDDTLDIIINNNLEFIGIYKSIDNGNRQLLLKDKNDWKLFLEHGYEDEFEVLFFSKDNNFMYCLDSQNANSKQFVKIDVKNKHKKVIVSDPIYDVYNVLYDKDTFNPLSVSIYKELRERVFLNSEIEKDFKYLKSLCSGEIGIAEVNIDQTKWLVMFNMDTGPIQYWLYDRKNKEARFLFYHRSKLLNYELQPMNPISFTARDGLEIHGYVTYPKGYATKKNPLIVFVHGGPWLRDVWGFNSFAQWLANRGYAVLQINFRGSSGYGKDFLNAGNKQWGKKMLDDLIDGVNWAQTTGYIDKDRVAIFGASYGGYAALCGATFTKDVFKCAIDICGRSNLFSRYTTIPPYWKAYIAMQKHRIGDPDLEPELLRAASPLFFADNISIPLFLAHGTNDARINPEESEQIVEKLKSKNIAHEYVTYPDEGHSFIKEKNRMDCFEKIEKFLEKYL